jgi:hypothetical protein
MMLGDCLWHVYAMLGKLNCRVYLLSRDGPELWRGLRDRR